MPAAIETRNLTKQWGDLKAVDKLDLVVNEGECYAFLGRNGSGKSTTARMLLDFIRPTGGSSELLGGSGSDPDIRARVGYLPGDLNLPRAMTGRDAFNYFGGLRPSGESNVRDSLVERFGLDPVLQEEFRDLLAERKADGATIWLTSHVMAEVARVADRVGLINEGKLVKELTFEELRHQATTEITFGFAEPVPPSAFEDVTSVAAVTQDGVDLVLSLNGPVGAVLKRAAELDAIRVEWDVTLPFITATLCLLIGWQAFLHRDLQSS